MKYMKTAVGEVRTGGVLGGFPALYLPDTNEQNKS